MKNFFKLISAVTIMAFTTFSVSLQAQETLEIRGAGSSFAAPLIERWIQAFQQDNKNLKFIYDSVGSGEGIERFIDAWVDFAVSDAAMNDAEIKRIRQTEGRDVKLVPITAGEVVIAYNIPDINGQQALRLPRDVYVDIFAGKIKRWNDPRIAAANPHLTLPEKTVQLIARRDSSGTTFAFTNHLSAVSDDWRDASGTGKQIDWPGNTMTASGNEGVSQRLKITHNSIGYVEYGFARRLDLPMAVLENRAGNFIAPGPESGKKALDAAAQIVPDDLRLFLPDPAGKDAYPIVSLVWGLLYNNYQEADKNAAIKEAFAWGLGPEGQTIASKMGYIPLPDSLLQRSRQALESIY